MKRLHTTYSFCVIAAWMWSKSVQPTTGTESGPWRNRGSCDHWQIGTNSCICTFLTLWIRPRKLRLIGCGVITMSPASLLAVCPQGAYCRQHASLRIAAASNGGLTVPGGIGGANTDWNDLMPACLQAICCFYFGSWEYSPSLPISVPINGA